jgi:hypothetical protein
LDPSDINTNPEDDEDPSKSCLFTPSNVFFRFFADFVAGLDKSAEVALGHVSARDPDALPPRNAFGLIRRSIYRSILSLGHGNSVFALKAGVMAGETFDNI